MPLIKRDVHVLGEERVPVLLDGRLDVTKYLTREVVSAHNPVYVTTGTLAEPTDIKSQYGAATYGARLVISERAKAMCDDLFEQFVAGDGPFQRSIIFCASDREATRSRSTSTTSSSCGVSRRPKTTRSSAPAVRTRRLRTLSRS